MNLVNISGKVCNIFINEIDNKPIEKCIYFGTDSSHRDSFNQIFDYVQKHSASSSYMIIAYEVLNWNKDFSPWQAPAVFGSESFDGGADDTLNWLENECIPFIEKNYLSNNSVENLLAGYSLAGLFSLWAFYLSDKFSGVASMSGSLWFPNWLEFISDKSIKNNSIVYLSLGNKEENTKNTLVKTVADITRQMDKILSEDKNVRKNILEWNEGNHFNDVVTRTAKGLAWLLN
ncbi:alpha/beta hydrolase [Terrisporobacter sp.]